MVGRAKPATREEKERLQRLHEFPCLCCQMRGVSQPNVTTVHHLLSGGRRRGHRYSINLCEWHHMARPRSGCSDGEMTDYYGPSLALGSRAFHEAFGSDDELLAKADKLIG